MKNKVTQAKSTPLMPHLMAVIIMSIFQPACIDKSIRASLETTAQPTTTIFGGHTATLLKNNLIIYADEHRVQIYKVSNNSSRSLDPTPITASRGHVATLLSDGSVFFSGGITRSSGQCILRKENWIYEPRTNAWRQSGALRHPRGGHTATLLPDNDSILIVGGSSASCEGYGEENGISKAEICRLSTGECHVVAEVEHCRVFHTTVSLPNNDILIIGGYSPDGHGYYPKPERYQPRRNQFDSLSTPDVRGTGATASLFNDNSVLIVGSDGNNYSAASLYDSFTAKWIDVSDMRLPIGEHAATVISSNLVLLTGGWLSLHFQDENSRISRSGWVFDKNIRSWHQANSLDQPRRSHSVIMVSPNNLIIAGGYGESWNIISSIARYKLGIKSQAK